MSGQQLARPPAQGQSAQDRDAWLKRVLGVGMVLPTDRKPVSLAPAPISIDGRPPPMLGADRSASDRKAVQPSLLSAAAQEVAVGGDRTLEIRQGPDGRVAFTAPPPPVGEITFSGGGGKGAALPGAVAGIAPIIAGVKEVKGASIGSVTASMVAAGVTPEEFKKIADSSATTKTILEGRPQGGKLSLFLGVVGDPLTGAGMYKLVRDSQRAVASKRLDEYWAALPDAVKQQLDAPDGAPPPQGRAPDGGPSPALLKQVKAIKQKLEKDEGGLTFRDLRTLHEVIPAFKELEVSATMMGDDVNEGGKIVEGKRQLAIFNADTQPDMEVAKACQASAALPPVFKPAEIELEGGFVGRFMDGGVLNNSPATQTVQAGRAVDPIPTSGSMAFVFASGNDQDDKDLLAGKVTPQQAGVVDKLLKADFTAATYANNRALADQPEDVVVVPLKFAVTDKNGKPVKNLFGQQKVEDYSGNLSGTVNFSIPQESKDKLQEMTAEATAANLEQRKQPKTTEFASVEQMLNCIGQSDLEGLAKAGFQGAQAALDFRKAALGKIDELTALQDRDTGDKDPAVKAKKVAAKAADGRQMLKDLDGLAGGDPDREAFVAREMSRSGRLDDFLKTIALGGGDVPAVAQAGAAVVASFDARDHAQNVLREAIYPKMAEKLSKPEQEVLQQVDDALRAARSPDAVNAALQLAIEAFSHTNDGKPQASTFADACRDYLMTA